MQAEEIVASIADDEKTYRRNPEQYSGFVRKVTKTRVDFHWARAARGKPDEMTINRHGVICSRSIVDGKTWFGYTLDPFGENIPYSVECDAGKGLLKRFVLSRQQGHTAQ